MTIGTSLLLLFIDHRNIDLVIFEKKQCILTLNRQPISDLNSCELYLAQGKDLLNRLQHQEDIVIPPGDDEPVSTLDHLEAQKQVKRLIQYMENRIEKLENLLEDDDRSVITNQKFEDLQRHIKAVLSWILRPGEKLLASQTDIGDSYETADVLRKRHEELEIKCTDTYGQYAELRHKADELIAEDPTGAEDIRSTRDYMDTVFRSFASRLERRRNLLITSVRFHRLAQEFSKKLDDLLELVCSEPECEDVKSAEKELKILEDKCDSINTAAQSTLGDGQSLLDEMSRPIKNASGKDITPDYSRHIKHINQSLEELQERKLRCDLLADVRKLKLQQILQLCTCEHDAEQKMEKVKCEPCKVRNRNNVSIHWCVICEESLCSDCTENHRSMKISRNHELIDINRMPIQTNIADQCCFKHDNLPFEYFCIDHDVLSCKECLAKSHRSCQKVMSVDIACKGAKQSQSFIDATELVDHVLETTHTVGKDEQDFIENIVKEANSVKTAVRIVKEEAIRHIEALEKSLLHDLDLKKDKIIQISKTTIKETEDIKKSTKDKQDIFNLVNKHGSEKQAFIAVHAYKQDLTDLEKRVTGITEKSTRFTISLNPQKLRESIHSIGSIELSEVPSNVIFVQKKKCQSQMPIVQAQTMPQFVYKQDLEIENAFIYGMTINDNNEVILVDNEQCGRILVYDKNDNFKYQIETKHPPWDIALIPGKKSGVLTSYQEEVLQFVDFDRKKISGTVSLKESNQGGVAASNENIYVGCKENINVLDLRGRFIRSMKIKNEIVGPWFMTLDKSENIYYTGDNILCCIRSDGTEVYTYSAPDGDTLWKLAVDNNGYVYVAVQNSGVNRIKPDGKLMDIVIKNENHHSFVGICFNIQFTKMILSPGPTISVFNQK